MAVTVVTKFLFEQMNALLYCSTAMATWNFTLYFRAKT